MFNDSPAQRLHQLLGVKQKVFRRKEGMKEGRDESLTTPQTHQLLGVKQKVFRRNK